MFSKTVDELERYFLSEILHWKLAYIIPYDIAYLILNKISNNNLIPSQKFNEVMEKTAHITELFYMCKKWFVYLFLAFDFISEKSSYSIAIASLLAATSVLNEKQIIYKIKTFISPNNLVTFIKLVQIFLLLGWYSYFVERN